MDALHRASHAKNWNEEMKETKPKPKPTKPAIQIMEKTSSPSPMSPKTPLSPKTSKIAGSKSGSVKFSNTNLKPPVPNITLQQINPEMASWGYKQGFGSKSWKKRWFVLEVSFFFLFCFVLFIFYILYFCIFLLKEPFILKF